VVRRYLEALESQRPKRGRRRTPESISKRLAAIDEQLATVTPLNRLHLAQERLDLERQLAASDGDSADLDELEAAFIEVAAAYAERRGLTYEACAPSGWRPAYSKLPGSAAVNRAPLLASSPSPGGVGPTSTKRHSPGRRQRCPVPPPVTAKCPPKSHTRRVGSVFRPISTCDLVH
jgi:hypothetical protein